MYAQLNRRKARLFPQSHHREPRICFVSGDLDRWSGGGIHSAEGHERLVDERAVGRGGVRRRATVARRARIGRPWAVSLGCDHLRGAAMWALLTGVRFATDGRIEEEAGSRPQAGGRPPLRVQPPGPHVLTTSRSHQTSQPRDGRETTTLPGSATDCQPGRIRNGSRSMVMLSGHRSRDG